MANDFLVFGGAGGANVIAQATYAALAARTAGFSAGVAQSAQLNKVWRQSSVMAAVLAQFISDQTGQDSVDDGTTSTLLANLKASMPGRLLAVRRFTSSGTYTPTTGTKSVVVEVIGGGGGGGGSIATGAGQVSIGGGGGGGAYAKSLITSGFSGVTMTVGAAGAAGAAGGGGGAGGTTSFGALLSAVGGGGGVFGGPTVPPFVQVSSAGGALPTSGNVSNARGFDGVQGTAATATSFLSGAGGASPYGSAGGLVPTATSAGGAASGFGAGGGGGACAPSGAAQPGGAGAPGMILVWEYL